MLIGYGGTRNTLSVAASGSGDLAELRQSLEGPVMFGLATNGAARSLFTFIDPGTATSLQKAKAAVHRRTVADALQVRAGARPCVGAPGGAGADVG